MIHYLWWRIGTAVALLTICHLDSPVYYIEEKQSQSYFNLVGLSMFRQFLFVLCSLFVMCHLTPHSEITFHEFLFNSIILSLTFLFFTELQPKCHTVKNVHWERSKAGGWSRSSGRTELPWRCYFVVNLEK